ncbi:MAG: hypothetical protein OXC82_00245 [Rhodobacteraceae bacterium]|nr:hypothetical protein [Paracoccaceae bacterium]MCY4248856.1 hypothetical protein [Paracoccaceae bacterium]
MQLNYGDNKVTEITTDWITLAGIIGILAFLSRLSKEIGDLRERMARLEGLFEGFTGRANSSPREWQ